MTTTFVVSYDGSDGAKRALAFATERAKAVGAELVIAYVLEWSPYSFLTPDEIEERHARRQKEVARAEEAIVKPALASLEGIKAHSVIRYGHIADTINAIAKEHSAAQIFLARSGDSFSSRVFGSTASKLAQSATVPCTIVP